MSQDSLYGLPETGDCWEWNAAGSGEDLSLEPGLGALFEMLDGPLYVEVLEGPPRQVEYCASPPVLQGMGLGSWSGPVRLECAATAPWTFRVSRVEEVVALDDAAAADGELPEGIEEDAAVLATALAASSEPSAFAVSLRASRLATVVGFDQLLCLPLLREVEQMEHQINTVRTVLRRFRGRALLCDEVGLGKTIEAGMILLELVVRGLAQRVLILAPPSLLEQWRGEMMRKFGLDFVTHDAPEFRAQKEDAWAAFPRIIASCHTAKRKGHREAVIAQEWDLIVVDEAHHFRNRRTLLWQLASQLRKKYILLLTATPVQNNLEELFNLVSLMDPGLLGTQRHFLRQFVDRNDRMTPKNVDDLHRLLAEVMVRNRRATIGFQFTRRIVHTERLQPSAAERELYAEVSSFVRPHLRQPGRRGLSRIALLTLQKELGSCPQAATPTLERLVEGPGLQDEERHALQGLAARARALQTSVKADYLLELLERFGEPMVVFTQFRAAQDYVARRLEEAGLYAVLFHGSLSRLEKEAAVETFRREGQVLLCTETGSEGRNLQFCNAVCNFDLPWNPMRIEQRIGRLSRIGQARDVYVFNLVAAGTIEEAVLHLLEAKINMFELVVGEIDMILGNWGEEEDFEQTVAGLWSEADDEDEFRQRMEELGERLRRARQDYLTQQAHDDRLFGDAFQP